MTKLNPLLHQELRLSIISFLATAKWVNFNALLDITEASKGNLSVQLKKLEEAKMIKIKKSFKNNYPLTECQITTIGRDDLEEYVAAIKKMLNI
ncbi:MAG: DNA-binding HxlR family transcriptional regulator [Arenicella sp.]|jgi:DNA-binding HxlR family transcriptional regulator